MAGVIIIGGQKQGQGDRRPKGNKRKGGALGWCISIIAWAVLGQPIAAWVYLTRFTDENTGVLNSLEWVMPFYMAGAIGMLWAFVSSIPERPGARNPMNSPLGVACIVLYLLISLLWGANGAGNVARAEAAELGLIAGMPDVGRIGGS